MASIWQVYEGREPTKGGPWMELPVSEAAAVFELQPEDFISDLESTPRPRFGNTDRDSWYLGYKHIVVEVSHSEGRKTKWRPGFYHSRIRPDEARHKLIEQAFTEEFGDENIVRVDERSTTDSQDRDALKITVVIAPGATSRLAEGAPLNALVRLQDRLNRLGEERTPIIEYATEAELAEHASR